MLGRMNVKFLKGQTNEYADNSGIVSTEYPKISKNAMDDYVLHPAFGTNLEMGGWDDNLEGIWVAKFEASLQDANKTSEGNSSKIQFKPNVKCSSSFTLDDKYKKSYNMLRNAESHLMKNSEWGAIAYLAQSNYGRNGIEISINDNPNIITGGGDFITNVNQSTTGNAYGVYDMSGGNFEVVSCYLASGGKNLNNFSFTSNQTNPKPSSSKYVTVYKCGEIINYGGFSSRQANYEYNSDMFGDAMYETSQHWSINNGSWFGDMSYYMLSFDSNNNYYSGEFVARGGNMMDAGKAGAFYFCNNSGKAEGSFRVVLCP